MVKGLRGLGWLELFMGSAFLVGLAPGCGSTASDAAGGAGGTTSAAGTGGTTSAAGTGGTTNAGAGTASVAGGGGPAAGGTATGGTAAGGTAAGGGSACHAQANPNAQLAAPTTFDAANIALAAAVVGACLPDDGTDRTTAHMWSPLAATGIYYYRLAMQADCLAHSNCGCAALDHCLSLGFQQTATCTPGCNGDLFSACGPQNEIPDGYRFSVDCGELGLSCDPAGFLCSDGAAQTCEEATFVASCGTDGRPSFCAKSLVEHGPKCEDLGLVCAAGECVGSGAACTNTGFGEARDVIVDGVSCAGSKLSACVNGKMADLDCTTRGSGFSCQTAGTQHFCGLAAECTPADDYGSSASNAPTCDGSSVVFCNAGRLEHVDCLALGFTGCDIDESAGHYGCIPGAGL